MQNDDPIQEPAAPAPASVSDGAPPPAEVAPAPAIAAEERAIAPEGWLASAQSLVVTVVIAVFVITFIIQAFQIPSESMEDTLLIGDYLLVDKAHYGPAGTWRALLPYSPVNRGDIIVFRYPIHPSEHFVKRVIGVPGDRIRVVRRRVFINGQPLEEPYAVFKESLPDAFRDNFPGGNSRSTHITSRWYLDLQKLVEDGQMIIPSGHYFVMGDNRDQSLDSRYWGFVPEENIIGRPLMIYWSMQTRGDGEGEPVFTDDESGRLLHVRDGFALALQNIRWRRILSIIH